jgi:hypothetical protein
MADLREVLDKVLDEQSEEIKKLVQEAFKYEREREFWTLIVCKHCGKNGKYPVKVQLPDYKERVKALDLLMTQAKGKPKETVRHEGVIGLKNVSGMSMAELDEEEKLILEAHPELRSDYRDAS